MRLLGGNDFIFTLDEAAGERPRPNMLEDDVPVQPAEKGDPGPNQHGHARDHNALNQPRLEKPLNRDPAIHVGVANATSRKLRYDGDRVARQAFDDSAVWSESEWMSTEYKDGLLLIWPHGKRQDRLERLTANDKRVHRGHELGVAVGLTASRW